jgi:solute carrier family 26 (sodium-independent sulfate anion transporter), member 11
MKFLTKAKQRIIEDYQTDANVNRAKRWAGPIARGFPNVAADYLSDKLPIAHWLPHYDYRWLFQDFVAGITIGVMLIPQGLAYAKVATIPVANGLYASWFPQALYLFLGTSKGKCLHIIYILRYLFLVLAPQ